MKIDISCTKESFPLTLRIISTYAGLGQTTRCIAFNSEGKDPLELKIKEFGNGSSGSILEYDETRNLFYIEYKAVSLLSNPELVAFHLSITDKKGEEIKSINSEAIMLESKKIALFKVLIKNQKSI